MTNKSQVLETSRVTGVFKDYLLALDSIRNELTFKEEELNKILIGFYKIDGNYMNENSAKEYLMTVSKSLDHCNAEIHGNKKYIIIDGQVPIANMINQIKNLGISLNIDILEVITDFWENIKYTLELFQILVDNFDHEICFKIRMMYSTSGIPLHIDSSNTPNDKVVEFLRDIDKFSKQLPEKISKCRLLIKSCGTHMRSHLLDRSSLADRILIGINTTQYPLLKVVPDLGVKLTQVFQVCRKWLDREESFIYEMNQQIREKKLLAKEKELRIVSARERQNGILKSVKESYLLCQNTKKKLKEISTEIKFLEEQIRETGFLQKNISEEKLKTMNMTEFLNLSITQTRKNYALQMRRQRLLNQVRQMETTLSEIDFQIHSLRQNISFKSDEKNKTHQKLLSEEKTYHDARVDLELYSKNLYKYKAELNELRLSLTTMESLKLLKTSPEFIENISGLAGSQRQSVQLAPSLKNTIDRKIGQVSNKS